MHVTESDWAENAGIAPEYYKAVFKYLSSYVHADGYSMSQITCCRSGELAILALFNTTLEYCMAFLALSIRDFRSQFPELDMESDSQAESLVRDWLCIVRNFKC